MKLYLPMSAPPQLLINVASFPPASFVSKQTQNQTLARCNDTPFSQLTKFIHNRVCFLLPDGQWWRLGAGQGVECGQNKIWVGVLDLAGLFHCPSATQAPSSPEASTLTFLPSEFQLAPQQSEWSLGWTSNCPTGAKF